jgi:hypothetical protein
MPLVLSLLSNRDDFKEVFVREIPGKMEPDRKGSRRD